MGTDPSRLVIKVKTSELNQIDGVWINSLILPEEVDLCVDENGVTLGDGVQRSFRMSNGGFFLPKATLGSVSYQNDVLYLGDSGRRRFLSKPKHVVVLIPNEADLEKVKAVLPATTEQPFGLNQTQIAKVADSFQLHKFLTQLEADYGSIIVTQTIIAINVLAFIAIVGMGANLMEPSPAVLLKAGANYGPLTLSGEWWRLLTSLFLHFGLMHLVLNMSALYQIGQIMERISGRSIFLLNYLGCGVMASFASVYFNNNVVSAGASGAIFGMFGSLIGYFLREKQGIPMDVVKKLRNSALVFALLNLIMGFTVSGIDNAAHIGGFLTGLILGFLTALPLESNSRKNQFGRRFVTAALTISMLLAITFMLIPRRGYSDFKNFNEFFTQHEKEAISAFDSLARSVESAQIDEMTFAGRLHDECLSHWVEIRKQGEQIKDLEDGRWSKLHTKYMEVAGLWIESLNKMITGIRTNDQELYDQGMNIRLKIQASINEFNQKNN